MPPGQEGKITLTVKTDRLHGNIQKSARVFSNDPVRPVVRLFIKGTVTRLVDFDPQYVSLRINKGEPAEAKITITNNDRTPLKILDVESSNRDFTTRVRTIEAGKRYEVDVKLKPQSTGGRYHTTVTVTTNNQKSPQLRIPVMVMVTERVQALPERLTFGRIHRASLANNPNSRFLLNRTISVRSQTEGFRVIEVKSTLPFVKTELVAPQRDRFPYRIKVTLAQDELKPGPFNGFILVRTNDKEFAELKIPVSGEVE
ncbi:MAG: DUF1573 domain-containing protein [Acidobacteria bacterium]|nr:MAG: DUF1573 domain-containing protein [Acidobacteriota bacterium]